MRFVTCPCRVRYTLPQYGQAAGRVSGESLTCGSVNLTLGIGGVSWSGYGCLTQTLPSFPALFFPHRLWDGYRSSASLTKVISKWVATSPRTRKSSTAVAGK